MTRPLFRDLPALLADRYPLPIDRPFTTAQACEAGVSKNVLSRLCAAGLVRRLIRGVYVGSEVHDSRELRGRALALVVPVGSVVTDWSACWYWTGFDRPGTHLEVPPLSVFRFRGHGRLRNGLVVSGQRWLERTDVVAVDERLLVTTPIRTAWDLGRLTPPIVAIGGLDALARHGSFTPARLVDGVERFKRQRGVVQLRVLAPLTDPRSESPGESALRLRWLETPGLPKPELQIPVLSEDGVEIYRLDLGVEELRFGAEYDGERWHSTSGDVRHDGERRERLDREFGWTVSVFRRRNVYGVTEDSSALLRAGFELALSRQRRSA